MSVLPFTRCAIWPNSKQFCFTSRCLPWVNRRVAGDKAYDSNSFRESLRKDGIKPVIPGRSNRKKRIRHDKQAYKDRNVIERCYCRLKDFRRIATRYDKKLARNYFSAQCLVAAVAFWL